MRKKHPILFFFLSLFILAIFIFIIAYAVTVGMDKWFILPGDKIAVVRIEGVILDSAEIIDELKEYSSNDSVKAILLRIDSPGGAVVPAQEIYEEIKRIRSERNKKVITSMGSVAASGGYYIASASDRIIANPGSITGSIGVILELANISGLMDKVGIKSVVIKSGKYKDTGSMFRTMEEEERNLLQQVIDDTYRQFVEAISEGRGIDIEKLLPIADGRIFTGRQAKEMGLVDDLGGLEYAIRVATDMAGIKGEPVIIQKKKGFSIIDLIRGLWSPGEWIGRKGKDILRYESFFRMKYLLAY